MCKKRNINAVLNGSVTKAGIGILNFVTKCLFFFEKYDASTEFFGSNRGKCLMVGTFSSCVELSMYQNLGT